MINETQRIGSYAGRPLGSTGGGDEAGGAAASEASKELGSCQPGASGDSEIRYSKPGRERFAVSKTELRRLNKNDADEAPGKPGAFLLPCRPRVKPLRHDGKIRGSPTTKGQ